MISRKELTQNKQPTKDKALGALAGLAIGDSFGDAGRCAENHLNYGMITNFPPGESWSTDDTEFALFTAKMLIEHDGRPTSEDFVEGWRKHIIGQDEFPRGGNSEIDAAQNIKRGIMPPFTGKYSAFSFSDGAAMRIAPVGIVCAADIEAASSLSKVDAQVSHYRSGVWGAQAVACAVAVAMADATDEEIIDAALSQIPEDSWFYYNFKKMLDILEACNYDTEACWMQLHDEFRTRYKAAVEEALVQAFALFVLAKGDFKRGMLLAANFGRDADTIGAVVGAILGARGGYQCIPDGWIEKVRYCTGTCLHFTKGMDIKQVAEQLARLIG